MDLARRGWIASGQSSAGGVTFSTAGRIRISVTGVAPGEGRLPLRQQTGFPQRLSVAASRAQDQIWVVHSVDPSVDVKPGDLRRRLIEYAHNPCAFTQVLERTAARAESVPHPSEDPDT